MVSLHPIFYFLFSKLFGTFSRDALRFHGDRNSWSAAACRRFSSCRNVSDEQILDL
jgi:hypothetical protein